MSELAWSSSELTNAVASGAFSLFFTERPSGFEVSYERVSKARFELLQDPRVQAGLNRYRVGQRGPEGLKVSVSGVWLEKAVLRIQFSLLPWSTCRGFQIAVEEDPTLLQSAQPLQDKGSSWRFPGPGILSVHVAMVTRPQSNPSVGEVVPHLLITQRNPKVVAYHPGAWSFSMEEQVEVTEGCPERPEEATTRGLEEELGTKPEDIETRGFLLEPRIVNPSFLTVARASAYTAADLLHRWSELGGDENVEAAALPLDSVTVGMLEETECLSHEILSRCLRIDPRGTPGSLHPTSMLRLRAVSAPADARRTTARASAG